MSEVDRLSNSGLYPMLPIADRRGSNGSAKEDPGRKPRGDAQTADQPGPKPPESTDPAQPRPPKSLIDEYA